jgi:hypothetical protein
MSDVQGEKIVQEERGRTNELLEQHRDKVEALAKELMRKKVRMLRGHALKLSRAQVSFNPSLSIARRHVMKGPSTALLYKPISIMSAVLLTWRYVACSYAP